VKDGIAHLELLLPPAPNGAPWLSDMKAHLSSTNWRMSANICGGGGHGVGVSQWYRARGKGEWLPIACGARTPEFHRGGVLSVRSSGPLTSKIFFKKTKKWFVGG
jgi:hypothetical protein